MPKTLKSFEFKEAVGKSEYNWDLLLSGKILQLVQGEDFNCKPQTFRMMAYKHAKKRGQTVQVASAEGGLVIKASDPADAVPPPNGETTEG